MTYDAENHLTAVGSLMTAGYTSGGQRAWKQNSSGKTYFIYDGLTPVSELAPNGTVLATNTFGVSGLTVKNTSLANCFYLFDLQGNVVQRMYALGGQWSVHMFSAFGTSTSTISTTFDPYSGFGGQAGYYTDWEIGLQLCGSRYYDAAAGRFITRDPIEYDGGINLYNYTANNSINRLDPTGLDYCDDLKKEIERTRGKIIGRYMDMRDDKYKLYPINPQKIPGVGSWKGHGDQLNGWKTRLRNLLTEYGKKCGDVNDLNKGLDNDCWHWATVPTPSKPAPKNFSDPGLSDETWKIIPFFIKVPPISGFPKALVPAVTILKKAA